MTQAQVASLRLKPLEQGRWADAMKDMREFAQQKGAAFCTSASGGAAPEEEKEPFIFEVFDAASSLFGPPVEVIALPCLSPAAAVPTCEQVEEGEGPEIFSRLSRGLLLCVPVRRRTRSATAC